MEELLDRPALGPYRITRPLEPGRLASRWLAMHERDQSSHVLHEFALSRDKAEQRRFLSGVEALAGLEHPHILPIEHVTFGQAGLAWLVTPYTGNQEGVLTLRRLLEAKSGQMPPPEVGRALMQLLEAAEYAHSCGLHHGPVRMEEALVDRHGSLAIELYGMARCLGGLAKADAEVVRDEVRSLAEMAYTLLTGLGADEPRIPAGRLVKRLDRRWEDWLNEGLDPAGGFETPGEALERLPGGPGPSEGRRTAGVRVVLGRVRSALGQP
jgi:serine/threonine protein kinase